MKIMIVEDNERMRKFIKVMVSGFADNVCECIDGEEAVQSYGTHHPDWVLMDIEMKKMDGITATDRIKHLDPKAKILMVTHHDDPRLREKAEQAGACGYVLKEQLYRIEEIIKANVTRS